MELNQWVDELFEVFDEDKDVTGNVQKGMEWNVNQSIFNSKGILGDNEQRIYYFHKVFFSDQKRKLNCLFLSF
mgnify:CR=1 FL=1